MCLEFTVLLHGYTINLESIKVISSYSVIYWVPTMNYFVAAFPDFFKFSDCLYRDFYDNLNEGIFANSARSAGFFVLIQI